MNCFGFATYCSPSWAIRQSPATRTRTSISTRGPARSIYQTHPFAIIRTLWVLRTTIAPSRLGKRLVHGFELPFWVRLFCARDGWVSDQKVHSENYIMRTPCECVSYLHSKNFIPILRCVSCPAVTYLLALSYSITMEDTKQKIYRPWPSGPPTYQQTTDDQTRDVTQNRDWNYSLFECFSPGSLCGLITLSWLYVLTSVTDSI